MANVKQPDILLMWGDDIGISNLSCYSDGLIVYETPNIDRVAREGLRFLHYYGEPRAVPPSFNPANLMEETLHTIKAARKLEAAFPMLREQIEKARDKAA
jgi:hypothetical protein